MRRGPRRERRGGQAMDQVGRTGPAAARWGWHRHPVAQAGGAGRDGRDRRAARRGPPRCGGHPGRARRTDAAARSVVGCVGRRVRQRGAVGA